jgi:hypothetical protein
MSVDKMNRYLLLGFPRSGTTLLSRLLNGHPDISCPPETYSFAAGARFLAEQTEVEGPPIGILTALGLLDFTYEDTVGPLRKMLFEIQDKIAGDHRVWVEKTGANVFHIEKLEPLLTGHTRFIYLVRNPLDVVASNMDLAATMGAQLSDIFAMTRGQSSPHEGLLAAWIDRTNAMDAFAERHNEDCYSLRYEDLVSAPEQALQKIMDFMALDCDPVNQIKTAFSQEAAIGLGDFRIDETTEIRPLEKNIWRKRLPRNAASRMIPMAAGLMERHGYTVPKAIRAPDRDVAIKQFKMAVELKRSIAHRE